MFKKQPKIDIKPSKNDKKWIFYGWVICLLHLVFVAYFYFDLPEQIPIHYNLKGEADGFGDKSTIWVMPLLGLAMYYGMTLIATKVKPHLMNYPVKVTKNNAPKLYAMSIKMLALINLIIAMVFFILTIEIIGGAKKWFEPELSWLTILLISFVIIIPFYFILKMFKIPK